MAYSEDTLQNLYHSTIAFYNRFKLTPDIDAAIHVFREEVNELIEAARENENRDHIAEEAADVMVTALGLCWAADVEIEQLIRQVNYVISKNDAKNHHTHEVNARGKIARRNNAS